MMTLARLREILFLNTEKRDCYTYHDIHKALSVPMPTLYNAEELKASEYVGRSPRFTAEAVFEWLIPYTARNMKRAA